ncbi:hypothetical protein K449DRAFT_137984 [Hypoxylon sp. EC38]|nr:hypothetical protein K449DRAFT_137984 [Hypoxylon sp. EC38]
MSNMALINGPPQLGQPQVLPATRPGLLSLSKELRLKIYNLMFSDIVEEGIRESEELLPGRNHGTIRLGSKEPLALLRVCKQINAELAPIIYQRVWVSCATSGDEWLDFFTTIGPQNAALIEDFGIDHGCCSWLCAVQDADDPDYNLRDYSYERKDELLDAMTLLKLNPDSVTIRVRPCDITMWPMVPEMPFDYDQRTGCRVYNDIVFLKFLTLNFGGAKKITLEGRFNPLWAFTLKQKLNHDIDRPEDPWWEDMVYYSWVFVRPPENSQESSDPASGAAPTQNRSITTHAQRIYL